ncbi:hypothetical protein HID58_089065 [Brassica napus]|uniref:RNase H type-1 domain-containing protein n=1 Tax=Brassica napus TaxID=3708 RepID=A0ABQ7XZA6_BRANA|nr:hypothetical protein HID58_089065 [Brassica napus]
MRPPSVLKAFRSSRTTKRSHKEIFGIVADIKALAASFSSINFSYVSRSKNLDADLLSKSVLRNSSCTVDPVLNFNMNPEALNTVLSLNLKTSDWLRVIIGVESCKAMLELI